MAKANLLNTSTSTFLELIGNGRLFKVPAYQRDYSWTEEQWEDLWTDIADLAWISTKAYEPNFSEGEACARGLRRHA